MVKVTDKEIQMHPGLKEKLDLMIHRMEKRGFDNFLLVDGKEGFGKTTFATQVCYYVSYETKRKFDVDHIFFRVTELLENMKKTKSQIFLLDEAELDLLSEQRGKVQRYFIQMLMAARKKNHFIIAIIPSIAKLKRYVVERAIGLARIYSPNGIDRGTYAYYKEESKNALYNNWAKRRKMEYRKFYNFNGRFDDDFVELVDNEKYEKKKDAAIESIGEKTHDSKTELRHSALKYALWKAFKDGRMPISMKKFAENIGITSAAMAKWGDLLREKPYIADYLEDGRLNL